MKVMLAAVLHDFSDLRLEEVPVPQCDGTSEVIVEVRSRGICQADHRAIKGGRPPGFTGRLRRIRDYCAQVPHLIWKDLNILNQGPSLVLGEISRYIKQDCASAHRHLFDDKLAVWLNRNAAGVMNADFRVE